ncbi:MAG: Gfo/Idh/MocA family oxidoreductase [Acidobacteriota bacterium]|nr:Gfo/Idh/MocA family oxidoreductase [Acidobacteriota bacterium]
MKPPLPPAIRAPHPQTTLSRRGFLVTAGQMLAASGLSGAALDASGQALPDPGGQQNKVDLPALHAATEAPEKSPSPPEPASQRTGYAIVGLGHLSLEQILPAFGKSKLSKPAALVSGDRAKALKVAAQYGIPESGIYDYRTYERLADNPDVRVIYIVLPNAMHREYVERGAKLRKHILCEKPMATSARDCEAMIAACRAASVKLMIAYRQQYEPMNRAIIKLVREGGLGTPLSFIASNSQNQGDPNQWRQKLALAGGGCLPDVGIYCINAARFLTGQEPSEVFGTLHQPTDDPRFREVEETCSFLMKFPSGLTASCNSGYGQHRSQFLRLEGDRQWAELSPAFAYTGLKLRLNRVEDKRNVLVEPSISEIDQFAREMDHMSLCVQRNLEPHTPGEEGLQDQRIVEAIYQSARTGRSVKLAPPSRPTRGPDPAEDA